MKTVTYVPGLKCYLCARIGPLLGTGAMPRPHMWVRSRSRVWDDLIASVPPSVSFRTFSIFLRSRLGGEKLCLLRLGSKATMLIINCT